MKKLVIAVLAIFACNSIAIAETFEYEASGYISDVQIAGPGTSANGLLANGEHFSVRFTIETEEVQAIFDSYPDYEMGVYFNTFPIQVEFEGGFSIEAIPDMNNGFGPSYHWKYLNFTPNFEFRMHNISVNSPTDFVLSEPIHVDEYGIEIQFSEESEPFEILSGELGELPAMSELDWANLYLRFVNYGDPYALTNYVGHIETLELVRGRKPKKEKQFVCHVGNEVGPDGEVYLDDPDCVPNEFNDYFCPDAGKIDLISVPNNAKHLNNPSHTWDGISDYLPEEVGASGEGTEDSDGNGIDDGCEPAVCPCWDESDLSIITEQNQYSISCDTYNWAFPHLGMMQAFVDGNPTVFRAYNSQWNYGGSAGCDARYPNGSWIDLEISDDEADICISQVYARCEELGRPVGPQ